MLPSERRANSGGTNRDGKPGSGGKREDETPEEAHFYNTNVAPIVDELALHKKGAHILLSQDISLRF